ncbi:MAG: DNA mismatch repair endonuclease MutL [Acutalibacteraceae bacterium]
MPRINVLPKNIADLIAAGEVVERPSSVVKELLENAIDANAHNITLEIQNGGKTYIRVTDNGCGIEKEDVKKAFLSHATSKIKNAEDLDSISTLGFRGEALPSICAVSHVEVLTRTDNSEIGTQYIISGGTEELFDDAGCPVGTTVIVKDLFYNIPARMKFLKKDVQEGNYIANLIERIAVSNPDKSFRFIRDGKLQFSTPGNGDLKSAVFSVFGKEFTDNLIPINNENNGISVSGFICKPTAGKSSRSMQTYFVNKRYVKSVVLLSALEAAYKNSMMVGKFPSCVLFLNIPFEAVDVNVHPAKTEVRFFEEKKVFDCIYYGALSALRGDIGRVQASFSEAKVFMQPADKGEQLKIKETTDRIFINKEKRDKPVTAQPTDSFIIKEYGSHIKNDNLELNSPKENEPETLDFLKDSYTKPHITKIQINTPIVESVTCNAESTTVEESNTVEVGAVKERVNDLTENSVNSENDSKEITRTVDFKYIGEAFSTYLIAETDGKLILIDKHAAHERILFEKLKNEGIGESQMMLIPITVKLSADEYSAIIDNLEFLESAGYDFTDFGDRCVKVNACPPMVTESNIEDAVIEIAGYLKNNIKTVITEKLDWLYHSMACRGAVKAGNFTSRYEAEKFIEELLRREDIRYCPHGRPVMVEITQKEIEKQFKRIV